MAIAKDSPQPQSHRCCHGGRNPRKSGAPQTLPSSPTCSFLSSSSSSSDFEFAVVVSPRKSTSCLCPADELFYKGQLLPLQLSPRISMVRNLLLSASSCSSSDAASRDSTGSSTDSLLLDSSCCNSSRPSSVTTDRPEDDNLAKLRKDPTNKSGNNGPSRHSQGKYKARNGYFGLLKFSSVFLGKEIEHRQRRETAARGPAKRISATAKEVIGKYLKKVKPIYEKLSSQKQHPQRAEHTGVPSGKTSVCLSSRPERTVREIMFDAENVGKGSRSIVNPFLHSFSGNLRHPRKRSSGTSCPSSMQSSPSHSGVLVGWRPGFTAGHSDVSSMEELQSAIQGAIAHCKNSMLQNKKVLLGNGGRGLD